MLLYSDNEQTMGFPCLPELHPSAMFVTEGKTRKRLHDWPHDHFCWRKMSQPKEAQVTCTAPIYLKGFSVLSQQILFWRKGIYLQINRKKKTGKKRHPDPEPEPDTRSFSRLLAPVFRFSQVVLILGKLRHYCRPLSVNSPKFSWKLV